MKRPNIVQFTRSVVEKRKVIEWGIIVVLTSTCYLTALPGMSTFVPGTWVMLSLGSVFLVPVYILSMWLIVGGVIEAHLSRYTFPFNSDELLKQLKLIAYSACLMVLAITFGVIRFGILEAEGLVTSLATLAFLAPPFAFCWLTVNQYYDELATFMLDLNRQQNPKANEHALVNSS